jgi:cytochrome oxidase Cu insertion factor (SCO1/SenC/PrrC family)
MVFHRLLQILTGILLGLAVVAIFLLFGSERGPGGGFPDGSQAEPDPYPAPELSLRDLDGRQVSLEDFRGEVVLIFFGFANCPDVCPLTLARWSRTLERLEDRDVGFRGIFVSVDPERDTPDALGGWMESFHPSLLALTGSPREIAATARAWSVHAEVRRGDGDPHAHHGPAVAVQPPARGGDPETPPEPDDGYVVEHSTRTFVVDREGRVVRTLPAYLDPDGILDVLNPLLGP